MQDGTPIAGVLVNVTQNNHLVASDVTDEDGQAIFLLRIINAVPATMITIPAADP